MDVVNIKINGFAIQAQKGLTVLEAAHSAGIYIPSLCAHPDLEPGPQPKPSVDYVYMGGVRIDNEGPLAQSHECGICVVEIEGKEELEIGCYTYVEEGMVVHTDTDRVRQVRQYNLAKHSFSQFHGYEYRKLAEYVGIKPDIDLYQYQEHLVVDDQPMIIRDYNLCVGCTRCVRACRDLRGIEAIGWVYSADGEAVVGTLAPSLTYSGCRFCGACIAVCPTGALSDKVSSTSQIDESILLPCVHNCPAGIDIPRYIRYVAQGDYDRALAVIRERVPFPSVLGRVCVHPCEFQCRRDEVNEPIAIRALERFVADNGTEIWKKNSKIERATGKKVAVIGAGPSGLTAAYYLAKKGHSIAVYEALPEPGGMLMVGIPDYRLPKNILRNDIEEIVNVGVDIKCNITVGRDIPLNELRNSNDAVYISIGAHETRPLYIDGMDQEGIYQGIYFLRERALGKLASDLFAGKKVVVVGGGNVAIDCARSAVRLGSVQVQLICLESRDEMPAQEEEIIEAINEGVEVITSWGPKQILGNGKVKGVEFKRCTSVCDNEGRFNPSYDESVIKVFEVDCILIAIGQASDLSFIKEEGTITTTGSDTILVDSQNCETGRRGIFAGGDVVNGPSSVIESIAAGRQAASAIDIYLGGDGDISETLVEYEEPDPRIGYIEWFASLPRAETRCLSGSDSIHGFSECECGYTKEDAMAEALRCLQCDLRLKISDPYLPPEIVEYE